MDKFIGGLEDNVNMLVKNIFFLNKNIRISNKLTNIKYAFQNRSEN